MAETPVRFKRPTGLSLTRVRDRLSFLYLDKCAVVQDDNGTLAQVGVDTKKQKTVYLPVAGLSCLMLGPGTSITQQAVASLSRCGCAVSFVGSGAVRSYGAFLSPYAKTDLLVRQAQIISDETMRIDVARKMYVKRFPGPLFEFAPPDVKIEQLRGIEGTRMKAVYQSEARRRRLSGWRRNSGDLGPLDAVNEALNHANTALYGVVNSAVLALGLSPGLGIIHQGNRNSFVLDIADLYKSEVTIPLAFSLHGSVNPGRDATIALREKFSLLKLMPRIVDDIFDLLVPDRIAGESGRWDIDELFLWSPESTVESGPNYASLPVPGDT